MAAVMDSYGSYGPVNDAHANTERGLANVAHELLAVASYRYGAFLHSYGFQHGCGNGDSHVGVLAQVGSCRHRFDDRGRPRDGNKFDGHGRHAQHVDRPDQATSQEPPIFAGTSMNSGSVSLLVCALIRWLALVHFGICFASAALGAVLLM